MRPRPIPLIMTAALLTVGDGSAQLVHVRTLPVASGDQFLLLPSETLAMGGVTLAIDDSLGDPWTHPAKGVFVSEPAVLSSPTFYSISDGGGGAKTFPVAGLLRSGAWFGGAALTLQQLDNARRTLPIFWRSPWAERLRDTSARNVYAQGFVGRELGRGRWSIGVGGAISRLDAMDGVDLLYADADALEQSGSTGGVRVGLYRRGERDRVALLALHDRVSMTHELSTVELLWDTVTMSQVVERRVEINEDRTRTWGGHLEWSRDLDAPGWALGVAATMNHKSHPKIPDYDIQNIPRDPGTTWAWEAGVGLARTRGPTVFGFDVVVQPIWSETWQEALADTVSAGGAPIPEGGRTIENDFFFANALFRVGLAHTYANVTFRAGTEARSYDYDLEQVDHLDGARRDQEESWLEWTPTFGAEIRLSDIDLYYGLRITTGTGVPGTDWTGIVGRGTGDVLLGSADFIVAPAGPLTLVDATVITHQLAVRVPIR